MNKWDPRTIIVFVLAVSISLTYMLAIAGLVWHGKSLTDVGGEVMIALIGAVIAIVASYVGKPPTGGNDA